MPARRLFIEWDDDEESELLFSKRVADMRTRYPAWRISASTVCHSPTQPASGGAVNPVPRPPERKARQADQPSRIADFVEEQACRPFHSHRDGDADPSCESDRGSHCSDESVGNVVGERPSHPRPGLLVRCTAPPYPQYLGVVARVRGASVLVKIAASAEEWWCDADDLRVVATDNPMAPSDWRAVKDGLEAACEALLQRGVDSTRIPPETVVARRLLNEIGSLTRQEPPGQTI
jgi:hypothetical protein